MTQFKYVAQGAQGNSFSGEISAATREAAIAAIRQQGNKPINVTEAKAAKKSISFGKKVKIKDLVIFTRQLATMINAGVPIVKSLATLQAQTENKYFKDSIGQITKKVESGTGLSEALSDYPKIFPTIYINMVKAGEEGGILDQALLRLALQTEKDAAIKKKVKSAMTYPTVIGGITVLAFFVLMTSVVPKLGEVIKGMGAPLPTLTKVMLAAGDFMKSPMFVVSFLVLSVGGTIAVRRYIRTEKGRYQFHFLLLKLPIVKVLITKVAIARFARTFSSLMSAGVTVLVAIETTSGAVGNKVIEKELTEAAKAVKNGSQFSTALADSKVFPPIVSQMLSIGEETGQIDQILVKVAEFYEEEVDAFVDSLTSIIEPLMILVLGSMVGLVAASVFGPLSSLTQNIQ